MYIASYLASSVTLGTIEGSITSHYCVQDFEVSAEIEAESQTSCSLVLIPAAQTSLFPLPPNLGTRLKLHVVMVYI